MRPEPISNPWRTILTDKKYENPWILVEEHQVINPKGGQNLYGKVHFKNLAIGILPLDDTNNTWLVGQWRYPFGEYSWEIPMGGGLRGTDPLQSAKRELEEETGITALHWEKLLTMHLSNSVSDEIGLVYTARGLSFGNTSFDETEELALWKLPFDSAVEMCLQGKITDSLSLAAIFKMALQMKIQ